jgi:hypothetical protein
MPAREYAEVGVELVVNVDGHRMVFTKSGGEVAGVRQDGSTDRYGSESSSLELAVRTAVGAALLDVNGKAQTAMRRLFPLATDAAPAE